MGSDAKSSICYGVSFEDGADFPWEDNLDDWWLKESGFKPPFELFDEHGEYINGVRPPEAKVDEYYDKKHEWEKQHPVPVDLVYCGSDEGHLTIVAIPSSVIRSDWEEPKELSTNLSLQREVGANDLKKFYRFYLKYFKVIPDLKWYMSSYFS